MKNGEWRIGKCSWALAATGFFLVNSLFLILHSSFLESAQQKTPWTPDKRAKTGRGFHQPTPGPSPAEQRRREEAGAKKSDEAGVLFSSAPGLGKGG